MGADAKPDYAKIDPKTGQITPPKERPMGVTIVAMLYFIMAGVTAINILVVVVQSLVDFEWGEICCALPFILVVMFYLSIGAGLFMMMKQFWMWAMILAGFGLLFGIGNLSSAIAYSDWFVDGVPTWYYALPVLQIVINAFILLYLFKMKDWFREMDPQQMQQMQVKMMEKQLEQMKQQQGGAPPTEPPAEETKEEP